jgi:hypothetical protein
MITSWSKFNESDESEIQLLKDKIIRLIKTQPDRTVVNNPLKRKDLINKIIDNIVNSNFENLELKIEKSYDITQIKLIYLTNNISSDYIFVTREIYNDINKLKTMIKN